MICLGLDTALGACSAALADEAGVIARAWQAMATGHAEAIAPMTERLLSDAGIGFAAVGRIAVTTGPGTFTGQRIGLAFAGAPVASRLTIRRGWWNTFAAVDPVE